MLKSRSAKVLVGYFFLLFLAISFAATPPAQAITSGTVEYDFPTLGSIYPYGGGPISFTAPQTVFLLLDPPGIKNYISSNCIEISFLTSDVFTSVPFNGEVFTMPSDIITSISVDQNLKATVTFDAHDIYVNWQGLSFTEGVSYVKITTNNVPVPPAAWMLGSGLLGLVGWRRFRKS